MPSVWSASIGWKSSSTASPSCSSLRQRHRQPSVASVGQCVTAVIGQGSRQVVLANQQSSSQCQPPHKCSALLLSAAAVVLMYHENAECVSAQEEMLWVGGRQAARPTAGSQAGQSNAIYEQARVHVGKRPHCQHVCTACLQALTRQGAEL